MPKGHGFALTPYKGALVVRSVVIDKICNSMILNMFNDTNA